MLLGAIDRSDFSALSVSHVILENYIRREIGSLYFFLFLYNESYQELLRDLSSGTKVSRITEIYTCGFSKIKCLSAFFLFFNVPSATLSRLPFFFRFLETDRVLLSGRCNFILSV